MFSTTFVQENIFCVEMERQESPEMEPQRSKKLKKKKKKKKKKKRESEFLWMAKSFDFKNCFEMMLRSSLLSLEI